MIGADADGSCSASVARHPRELPCPAQRLRGAVSAVGEQHDRDGSFGCGTPTGVHRDRSGPRPGAQPTADRFPVQHQRAGGTRPILRVGAFGQQWPVRDADRRYPQYRTEVEGQSGPARMITAGGVHQEDVRCRAQRPDRLRQPRAFPQREQTGLVRGARCHSSDHGIQQLIALEQGGRSPGRVTGIADAPKSTREADPASGQLRRGRLLPRRRIRVGEVVLHSTQSGRIRWPFPHTGHPNRHHRGWTSLMR